MSLKSKLTRVVIVAAKYFLPICLLSICLVFTLSHSANLSGDFYNSRFILSAGLVSGFLALLTLTRKSVFGDKMKMLVSEFCAPLFIMSLTVLLTLNFGFVNMPMLPRNSTFTLILISILSGLLVFFTNPELDKAQYNGVAKNRCTTLGKHFAKCNLPNVDNLGYKLALFLTILLGLVLRILYADHWSFFRDEFNILSQAKVNLMFGDFAYKQLWILIELQTFLYKAFGFSTDVLFNRLPYILFSTVNTVLIYFCVKKLFCKKTALLTTLLFSISAFSIEMGMYIRQYEFNLMVALLLTTIVLYTHNRRLFLLSTLVYVLSVFHSLYFKDGYYMAAILVIPAILYKGYELLVKEHYARIIQRKVRLGFYLLATFVSFVFIFYVFVLPRISWLFTFKINIDWLRFLYSDSLNIGTIQIVLSVISVITTTAILFKTSTRKNGSFLLISYSVLIIVLYSLFANRYFAPRYIYYFFPLYLAFLTNGLLIAFQKKLLQSILFSLISISILASTTAYFREDRSYSRFVGTYNYESKYLQIFLNQTVGSTDMIVTSNANELLFFSPQSLDCVDTYNTDKGYQTLCNIIPFEKVTSTFTPTSTSYVIADWKRDPFTGADNSVINDIFKVRTQVLNSDYRVYEVTY